MFNYNQQNQPMQQQPMQQQPFMNSQQQGFVPQPGVDHIKQQQRQIHSNNLNQTLSKIYQLQNQPELGFLLQIMRAQQKIQIDTIDKTINSEGIKSLNATDMDTVFQRSKRIRQKNTKLLEKLLMVKGKLQRVMYQDMKQHSKYEVQTSQVLDRIRGLKSEMMQKCAYLRTLKINKNEEYQQKQRSHSKNQNNFSTVGTGLKQLKNGTQVLERQVIKQKTEMQLVIKYLNQNNY